MVGAGPLLRFAAAVAALAAGAAGPARGAEDAPCRVEVAVEPATAFVGEQMVYRVRVLRRESVREVRWLRALSFPSLRAEWLPGRSVDPRISGVGDAYIVSEDRRALFPVRAGRIEIPPASLGCRLASGGEAELAVPGAALTAMPLPADGRPADFAGVVGPVQVRTHLSARRVGLGETVRLAVVVAGYANVWAAAPPLDPAGPDLDAYPQAPELQLEPGERLAARRTFVWELVPRRAGRLALPAPRVPWFDPETGAYAVAGGPALAVEVRAEAPAAAAPRAAQEAAPDAAGDGRGRARWPYGLALGLLLAALAGVPALRRRRAAPLRAAAAALADAENALAGGDRESAARALAAALRAALALRVSGASALAPEDIAARAGGRAAVAAAAALLAQLDRARFAGTPTNEALPPVDQVRATIRALGRARAH